MATLSSGSFLSTPTSEGKGPGDEVDHIRTKRHPFFEQPRTGVSKVPETFSGSQSHIWIIFPM